jgi:GH18 family chitinase
LILLDDFANFVKRKGSAKALVAIGGSSQSSRYPLVADNNSSRTTFVNSVMALLSRYHFDGVMIDWQYPDKGYIDKFVQLLDKFDEKFAGTTYTLGITGPPFHGRVDDGYDVPKIIKYFDYLNSI